MYDVILRGGWLVFADGQRPGDIAIEDGTIAAFGDELAGDARETIDATGRIILPGVIDAHVHFNDPGRSDWEGVETGSAAAAIGGTTCFIDMPLNSIPATTTAKAFDEKLAVASRTSAVDFALWGGLVPGNLLDLPDLAGRGVAGFKAFMSGSGVDEFPRADDDTLHAGMQQAAKLGLPVAVHAEDETLTQQLAVAARAAGKRSVRDYLDSRPVRAEVEAIDRAIAIADSTGCSLHIVHVSSGAGVTRVAEARARGVDVTCETCPHYLLLTGQDVERLGAVAKCAPPLRDVPEVEALWEHVFAGRVDLLASDHSPAPLSMKQSDDFFAIWGGIAGCQSLLSGVLVEGHLKRKAPLELLVRLLTTNVASRFGLSQKGELKVGHDADLALVALTTPRTLEASDLAYRHPLSPYVGLPLHGIVRRTIVRGVTVAIDGKLVAGNGRLVRRARSV